MGAAVAIFAMTACADTAVSDRAAPGIEAQNRETAPLGTAGDPTVAIAALTGVPPTEANLFSEMLKEEVARASIPLSGSRALAFDMTGAMGAGRNDGGTYIVAVIDIEDTGGERLHRVVSETQLPENGKAGSAWDAVDNDELRGFAALTAQKIASWYSTATAAPQTVAAIPGGGSRDITTGSLAEAEPENGNRLPFDISVGPAPGDGNVALAAALDGALARRIATATWIGMERYRIEGRVVTGSRSDGRTDVSIHWLVQSASGAILGEVHQENALDAESIAGRWGEVAEMAAEAAADGVLAVLGRPVASEAASS